MAKLSRQTFIVEIDIERPQSTYMMVSDIRSAIERKLSPKKLNCGEVRVYARQIDPVETAALALSAAIIQHAADKAYNEASSAVDSHEESYNHGNID